MRGSYDLGGYDLTDTSEPADKFKDLSWRLDPEESLSDWTIVIESESGCDATTTDKTPNPPQQLQQQQQQQRRQHPSPRNPRRTQIYHVHKTQLGVGKRHSTYFSRLFRNKLGTAESTNSTSEISLQASAARAFPAVLDFIYSSDTDVDATTATAVAIRYLSNYFGIYELFRNINEFIQDDLTPSTAPIYLAEAVDYNDEKMIVAALDLCAEHFGAIDMKLLSALPSELFAEVVRTSTCESETLSSRVVEFCRTRPDAVTDDEGGFLKSLTCREVMPRIAPESALFLLKLCHDTSIAVSCDEDGTTTELRDRCVEAVSNGWKDVLVRSRTGVSTTTTTERGMGCEGGSSSAMRNNPDYELLPPHAKIELLESSLETAMGEITTLKTFVDDQARRHGQICDELRRDMQHKINQVNKTAQKYAFELSRFVRVPNAHTFGINAHANAPFANCTFEESTSGGSGKQRKGAPSSFATSKNGYGRNPPTSMPSMPPKVPPCTREGWVYHEKRDQQLYFGCSGDLVIDHYWPVFYYKGF